MYAPSNAGLIEVSSGKVRDGESLATIEHHLRDTFSGRLQFKSECINVGGHEALQATWQVDPTDTRLHGTRYSYDNTIMIIDGTRRYELRVYHPWHKPESRDAWVAAYEPVYDELVLTIEFE